MKLIVPKDIQLVSTNVAEDTTYPVWDSSATYNKGDRVRVENLGSMGVTKIFESIIDSNTGNYPPDNPDKWQDLGVTNKWAMFDQYVNTQTVNTGSIDVTVTVQKCNYLSLLEVEANNLTVEIIDPDTSEVLWSTSMSLRLDNSASWSDYFFGDFIYQRSVILEIPIYNLNVNVHVVLETSSDAEAKCGFLICGRSQKLGCTLFGLHVGILDYSRKETDEFGRTYLKQGKWAKRAEFDVEIENDKIDYVQRLLASVRATPCVWEVNNETTNYESLIIYGFYKDFSVVIPNSVISQCSITVEGLI